MNDKVKRMFHLKGRIPVFVTQDMVLAKLKAEVEKLWRPMVGPEFPEPDTKVLCRWKCQYQYQEVYTDYLVMTYDPTCDVWSETVELLPQNNDGDWRPIL